MNTEILWKQIEDYPNYRVSSDGRVLNIKRNKELKPLFRNGYKSVRLSKNGKSVMYFIHRLVAKAFIPVSENKLFVDHIDGDKTNNNVSNLRWVTPLENIRNENTFPKMLKRIKEVCSTKEFGEKMSKIEKSPEYYEKHKERFFRIGRETIKKAIEVNKKKVMCIETGDVWDSVTDLAHFLKVAGSTATYYCQGKMRCTKTITFNNNIVIHRPRFMYIEVKEAKNEKRGEQ